MILRSVNDNDNLGKVLSARNDNVFAFHAFYYVRKHQPDGRLRKCTEGEDLISDDYWKL